MKLVKIEKIEKNNCFDIEVEGTNCFFANNILVHNSNGGVRRNPENGKIIPQSRERIVSIGSDNAGFAAFVLKNEKAFEDLFSAYFKPEDDVTLYGEWCGGNIQSSVALNALPKHFVLFKVSVNDEYVPLDHEIFDNAAGIWNIYQIPTWEIDIDFDDPAPASEKLAELTVAVEEKSVWAAFVAKHLGIELSNTVSEGIVWTCSELPEEAGVWFKTKGLLHKGNDTTKVAKIAISDEKLSSIRELVALLLPEWRLEQGISYLKENNIEIEPKSTGAYLKWVCGDVIKEESGAIAASGFDWKAISGQVTQTAKQYFFNIIATTVE